MQNFSDERVLLHEVKNHAEFKQRLTRLKLSNDLPILDASVVAVTTKWLNLAHQHMTELIRLDVLQAPRAAYSRAYYAAYNASKAVRYQCKGIVSLKGDDHQKVADLPDAFPDVDSWTRNLQLMYEHRLRADYDNWSNTFTENTLKPDECVALATKFVATCTEYLNKGYGIKI